MNKPKQKTMDNELKCPECFESHCEHCKCDKCSTLVKEEYQDHCTFCGYPKKGKGCGECKGWKIKNTVVKKDDIPHEARLERYGLDFGYSNDPTAKDDEDICETCGGESFARVCQGCQEVGPSCSCTVLNREEYQEWLEYKNENN